MPLLLSAWPSAHAVFSTFTLPPSSPPISSLTCILPVAPTIQLKLLSPRLPLLVAKFSAHFSVLILTYQVCSTWHCWPNPSAWWSIQLVSFSDFPFENYLTIPSVHLLKPPFSFVTLKCRFSLEWGLSSLPPTLQPFFPMVWDRGQHPLISLSWITTPATVDHPAWVSQRHLNQSLKLTLLSLASPSPHTPTFKHQQRGNASTPPHHLHQRRMGPEVHDIQSNYLCGLFSSHLHLSFHAPGNGSSWGSPTGWDFGPAMLCSGGWPCPAWPFSCGLKSQPVTIPSAKESQGPIWLGWVTPYWSPNTRYMCLACYLKHCIVNCVSSSPPHPP